MSREGLTGLLVRTAMSISGCAARMGLRVIDAGGVSFFAPGGNMCRAAAESWTRRQFAAGMAAAGVVGGLGWSGGAALGQTGMTGEAAMRELMDGNERFVAGKISSFPE